MLTATLSIEGEDSWDAKMMFVSQHAGRDVTLYPTSATAITSLTRDSHLRLEEV
jgi:hypothetical protein